MEAIWNLDQRIQHAINTGWKSDPADEIFRFITYLGLDQVIVPLVLLLMLMRDKRRCAWQCLIAYAIAGIGCMVVKRITSRFRPGYPSTDVFVAPDETIFLNSFPSGHTAIAFAVAVTLALTWPGKNRRWVGLFAIVVATLVGISRVYRGIHWPTDVIGSMALAVLAALAAHWLMRRGREGALPRPSAGPA